jgi:hypothetical protein
MLAPTVAQLTVTDKDVKYALPSGLNVGVATVFPEDMTVMTALPEAEFVQ